MTKKPYKIAQAFDINHKESFIFKVEKETLKGLFKSFGVKEPREELIKCFTFELDHFIKELENNG